MSDIESDDDFSKFGEDYEDNIKPIDMQESPPEANFPEPPPEKISSEVSGGLAPNEIQESQETEQKTKTASTSKIKIPPS